MLGGTCAWRGTQQRERPENCCSKCKVSTATDALRFVPQMLKRTLEKKNENVKNVKNAEKLRKRLKCDKKRSPSLSSKITQLSAYLCK